MSFLRVIVITFLLGPIYILCVFSGFIYAPASHGGIFMNGLMPFFTLIFGFFLLKQKIFLQQMFGAATILFGACLAVYDGLELNFSNTWIGDIFFIIGAIFFSIYVVLSRLWNVTITQLLFCGSVINAILYLPIYFIFLPKGLVEVPNEILVLQMIYQGFVPNLIGIFFINLCLTKNRICFNISYIIFCSTNWVSFRLTDTRRTFRTFWMVELGFDHTWNTINCLKKRINYLIQR